MGSFAQTCADRRTIFKSGFSSAGGALFRFTGTLSVGYQAFFYLRLTAVGQRWQEQRMNPPAKATSP